MGNLKLATLDNEKRKWYIEHCAENGWSRNVLLHQIESGLYERQTISEKISNFESRLLIIFLLI